MRLLGTELWWVPPRSRTERSDPRAVQQPLNHRPVLPGGQRGPMVRAELLEARPPGEQLAPLPYTDRLPSVLVQIQRRSVEGAALFGEAEAPATAMKIEGRPGHGRLARHEGQAPG